MPGSVDGSSAKEQIYQTGDSPKILGECVRHYVSILPTKQLRFQRMQQTDKLDFSNPCLVHCQV